MPRDRRVIRVDDIHLLATVNSGGVRLNVSGARDHLTRLPLRVRWPATVHPGRIVVELTAENRI
jgi:hypothetical protein